jgi:endonuclease/exonuclease/phosphatase family metal-dependent hydrolase
MDTLGPTHDFIITDVTEGPSGNSERLAFIYNRSKISFQGVAGEIVLPFEQQISDVTKARQFARTPFACTFQAGWFKFNFATVHIYYGKDSMSSSEYKRRVKEIEAVAKFIAKRAKADKIYNHVLVGDFNIEDFESQTFDALATQGFEVFRNKEASNAQQTKFYDQISFMPRPGEVMLAQEEEGKSHGVFNVFESVFRDDDFALHEPAMLEIINRRRDKAVAALAAATSATAKNKANKAIAAEDRLLGSEEARLQYYLDEWRTFQISDHLPLFVELKIDFADSFLDRLHEETTNPPPPSP